MDIALSREVPLDELRDRLTALLPGVVVDVRASDSLDLWNTCDVLVIVMPTEFEFPCGLTIGVELTDESATEGWLRELARRLSIELRCCVICDGTGFGDDESPFWSIVWDSGAAYLADDCGTDPAEGEPGPVQIVRLLPALESAEHRVDLLGLIRRRAE